MASEIKNIWNFLTKSSKPTSSLANNNAQLRLDALNGVKGLDLDAVLKKAQEAGATSYKAGLDAFQTYDPQSAQLRSQGNAAGKTGLSSAKTALDQLFAENMTEDPGAVTYRNKAITEANNLISQGGGLSPEQQKELVRAGVANTASFGAGSGSVRAGVGKLLASEVEAQRSRRLSESQQLAQTYTGMKTARSNALAGLYQASSSFANLGTSISQAMDGRIPTLGLTGSQVASILQSNNEIENQKKLAIAEVGVDRNNLNYTTANRANPKTGWSVSRPAGEKWF